MAVSVIPTLDLERAIAEQGSALTKWGVDLSQGR